MGRTPLPRNLWRMAKESGLSALVVLAGALLMLLLLIALQR